MFTQILSTVEYDRATSWLFDPSTEGDRYVGFDATGWEDSTWILHAMFRAVDPSVVRRDDEDGRAEDDGAWATPDPRLWNRVRWSDYMDLDHLEPSQLAYPPCRQWCPDGPRYLPTGEFLDAPYPSDVIYPEEGSMDDTQFLRLVGLLEERSGTDQVYAYKGSHSNRVGGGGDVDPDHGGELWLGDVASLPELMTSNGGTFYYTPANIWPPDRSWFIYTDWDLWSTKISRPKWLVDLVRADRVIETVEWPK